MKYAVIIALLLLGCEQKPQPCRDVKLGTFTTGACPHPDHVLEEHVLKPSVCRCPKEK